mmetsp:Transcript_3670/g.7995  ORF Transcript_3670/g.7995 Transcript_3670/m.7995 type:complete len:250 (-) Transcript_3670:26-775(-)
MAASRDDGISTEEPPSNDENKPPAPPDSFSSSSSASIVGAGRTATRPDLATNPAASLDATFTASITVSATSDATATVPSTSCVQTNPSADPHHLDTAPIAEDASSEGRRRLEASAPASSMAPPALAISSRTDAGRETAAEESGGETTNQRTEFPSLAAVTAATSPTPPGGEITIIFLEETASASAEEDMDRVLAGKRVALRPGANFAGMNAWEITTLAAISAAETYLVNMITRRAMIAADCVHVDYLLY